MACVGAPVNVTDVARLGDIPGPFQPVYMIVCDLTCTTIDPPDDLAGMDIHPLFFLTKTGPVMTLQYSGNDTIPDYCYPPYRINFKNAPF